MSRWSSRGGSPSMVLRECKACGYVACICLTLTHAATCTRRRVLLAEYRPPPCKHEVTACGECFPCDCGGVEPPCPA